MMRAAIFFLGISLAWALAPTHPLQAGLDDGQAGFLSDEVLAKAESRSKKTKSPSLSALRKSGDRSIALAASKLGPREQRMLMALHQTIRRTIAVMAALAVLCFLVMGASLAVIFRHDDYPPWAAFVPGYNAYLMTKIVDKPAYWLIFWHLPLLIPVLEKIFGRSWPPSTHGVFQLISLVAFFLTARALAKRFEKPTIYSYGLTFLPFIFLPRLAIALSGGQAKRSS